MIHRPAGRVYPHDASGKIHKYDDLPARYHANIDTTDQPLDRKTGDKPALTERQHYQIVTTSN